MLRIRSRSPVKDAFEQPVVRTPTGVRAQLERFVERRRYLLVALGLALAAILVARAGRGGDGETPEASLALALAGEGLVVDEASVVFFGDDTALSTRPVLFRARPGEGQPHDVYYAEARAGRGTSLLDVRWVSNLTRTSSADEGLLTPLGERLLYASVVSGQVDAVTLLDMSGEPEALTEDWPLRARAQNAISNVQETGRRGGVGRVRYRLTTPVDAVAITTEGDQFSVDLGDGEAVVIDPASPDEPTSGASLVEVTPQVKGMPGTITWVVDTVRNLSFVGPEPIEWLEHTVFARQGRGGARLLLDGRHRHRGRGRRGSRHRGAHR